MSTWHSRECKTGWPHLWPHQLVRIFRILPLMWSPLTESNRRSSPYHLKFPRFHCPACASRRPSASADLVLAPACGICDRSGDRARSGAAAGAGPTPGTAAAPPAPGLPIQARPVGLPADQPRPLRRSRDGQTIFPLPPAQGPKVTLNRRFPTSRKDLNQRPYLAGSHRRQPRTLGPAEDHTAQHAGHTVRRPSRHSAASTTGPSGSSR